MRVTDVQADKQRRTSWRRTACWIVAGASRVGTSHLELHAPCQDRFEFEVVQCYDGSEGLIAVVSDGASSASRAGLGAEISCFILLRRAKRALEISGEMAALTDATVHAWFSEVREHIRKLASDMEQAIPDFSATALLVVATRHDTICAQVGDGGIILQPPDLQALEIAFWPERGQGDATFFATSQRDTEHIRIRRFEPITGMMLFSDGLQELMLDETNRSIRKGFPSMFLHPDVLGGGQQSMARDLESFLDSDYVNARTNDDKSLIVAHNFLHFRAVK